VEAPSQEENAGGGTADGSECLDNPSVAMECFIFL
jgi:hypothetical protein